MTTDGINIRQLACEVLLEVTEQGGYSHQAISAVLEKYQYLPARDRKFFTRLTEGTIEKQITLDYILNQFSSVKVRKMKPVIRTILRMGVYQICYMDSVPDSAACNESVKLATKKGFRNLKGFVNGILRNISRSKEQLAFPDETEQPVLTLSVRYSIPEWIISRWADDYGLEKTSSMAAAFENVSRLSVRTDTTKITPQELTDRLKAQEITAEPVQREEMPSLNYGLYLSGYDHLTAIPEFVQGFFTVQDVSSMLAIEAADIHPGDHVIDVCAAPGGKSLHAAEKLNGQGIVEARDLTDYKVSLIEENIKKSGHTTIHASCMDAREIDTSWVEKADVVIADLPCSGLGVLRKKPDIRYRVTEEQLRELAALQREILSVVCTYVRPGGTLLYSTCTIDRLENEENTRWFLENQKEFQLKTERQIFPDEGELDGFYYAIFKKEKDV